MNKLQCTVREPYWYENLNYKFERFLTEMKYKLGVCKRPDSSLISHAKREFLAVGYIPLDVPQPDDPNKWIQENVLELLEVFAKQGHSGTSAPFCVDLFKKLASYDPLCPLTGEEHEWNDVSYGSETEWYLWYQNNRCSHVFKDSKDGVAYDGQGYVFWHWYERPLCEDEEGYPGIRKNQSYFTGEHSRKLIEFPYTPTTEYVEVDSFEVNKDSNERESGSGWWETIYPDYILKQTAKLNEARGK